MKTIEELCKSHNTKTYFQHPNGLIGVFNYRNVVLWYKLTEAGYSLAGETPTAGFTAAMKRITAPKEERMNDTLDDVESWLKVGIKACFPFHIETLATFDVLQAHFKSISGKGAVRANVLSDLIQTAKNRLQHQIDLYKITNDGEFVSLQGFTISRTEYAGPNLIQTPDGSLDNERIEGFLVEVATQLRGSEGQQDMDVCEVGKFTNAALAAQKVIELLFLDHLNNVFQAEGEARDRAEIVKQAGEVF